MAWFGPNDECDDNCCPVQCENPPVLTCRKYETGYGAGGFEYTVEDADFAWISEDCDGVITIHAVALTDRDASGVFAVTAGCDYCIRARNDCGEVSCCDDCNTPKCWIDSVEVQPDGSIIISWRYASKYVVLPGGAAYGDGDPVTVATLDGVDILDDPHYESGTATIAKADIPDTITLFISNDCGESSTCTYETPCCWKQFQKRISIADMADIDYECEVIGPVAYPPIGAFYYQTNSLEYEYSLTGLTALNGTHLFDVNSSDCSFTLDQDLFIGYGTLHERFFFNGLGALFTSGNLTPIAVELLSEFDCTVSIYLRPTGLIYGVYPSAGIRNQGYTTWNGVHRDFPPLLPSPFDRMICPWRCTPASNPPCPTCRFNINDTPVSICGSIVLADMVSYLWPEAVDLTILGCAAPASISNGNIETEYLE